MEERKSLITPKCGDSSLVSDISTSECGLNSILIRIVMALKGSLQISLSAYSSS